ncbi:MAG: NAD(P)H-dependent oxidoreductase [Thermodesulfovibrionales bacterium]|nr:NAD(P)H-dependent oxidoreductase [Thermodesulfovibrionales bacterium]
MKQLVIYCHPNPKSFCSAIKDKIVETLKGFGDEVVVRDLYSIGFNPVLGSADFIALQNNKVLDDTRLEQDFISTSDVLNLVYPIWWTGMPSMMKGYIDRVFLHGFAYAVNSDLTISQLLKGKKAFIFNTMGTPNEIYENSGMIHSMKMTSDKGIFEFCGIEVVSHVFFGAVPYVDESKRRSMLDEVSNILRSNR